MEPRLKVELCAGVWVTPSHEAPPMMGREGVSRVSSWRCQSGLALNEHLRAYKLLVPAGVVPMAERMVSESPCAKRTERTDEC